VNILAVAPVLDVSIRPHGFNDNSFFGFSKGNYQQDFQMPWDGEGLAKLLAFDRPHHTPPKTLFCGTQQNRLACYAMITAE